MDILDEISSLKKIRVKRDNLPWVDNESYQLKETIFIL